MYRVKNTHSSGKRRKYKGGPRGSLVLLVASPGVSPPPASPMGSEGQWAGPPATWGRRAGGRMGLGEAGLRRSWADTELRAEQPWGGCWASEVGRGWEGPHPVCAWIGLAKDFCWTVFLPAEIRWCPPHLAAELGPGPPDLLPPPQPGTWLRSWLALQELHSVPPHPCLSPWSPGACFLGHTAGLQGLLRASWGLRGETDTRAKLGRKSS